MPPQGEPGPLHAMPEIAQVTCWLDVPSTAAVNICCAPGASVTLGGETLTTTCGRMVTLLVARSVASSWLMAWSITGLGVGMMAGARKSTLAALDEASGWQGFEPATQI